MSTTLRRRVTSLRENLRLKGVHKNMAPVDSDQLLLRIERLERRNRLLTIGLLVLPLLAVVGWQAGSDTIRTKRLEIIDDRGVPLVVLSPDRTSEGGMITLRDRDGEKRAWWQAGIATSSLTLNSQGEDGAGGDSTLGLSVGPKSSGVSMLSKGGASMRFGMQSDQPKVELYDTKGRSLFAAPWSAGQNSGD